MSADDVEMQEEAAPSSPSQQQQPEEARNVPESVTVYLVGQSPITVALAGMTNFAHIMAALVAQGVDMESKVLVDDQDTVKDSALDLHNEVPEAGLAVKTQIMLAVTHDNMEWMVPILLNSKMTVHTVKSALQQQDMQTFRNVTLTWKGVVVPDDMRTDSLEGIGLLASSDESDALRQTLRFIGRKYVSVMDIDMGESSLVELQDVTDNMTVRDVLTMYQTRERRGYLHMPLLSIFVEGETNAETIQVQQNLHQEDTIYNAKIDNGAVLALKTGMFEVVVKESSDIEAMQSGNKAVGKANQRTAADVPGIRVHVFDWWKVGELKGAYSGLVTDGLSANDQLYLDSTAGSGFTFNDELNEDKPLYHYQVRDSSVLLVKREDFTTTYCYYLCADCGSDVRLKQKDAVRCRECGHRIVFKRRIAKPCQYLCR